MTYHHTQHAPLHWLMYPIAVIIVAVAQWLPGPPEERYALWAAAAVVVLLAFAFQTLTISDEGDRLLARYGPLPLFQKTIRYDDITGVETAKSSIVDGWGIHWVPGRGWTYNLWGFDCVEVYQGGKITRLGTDDPEGLVAFLSARIGGG